MSSRKQGLIWAFWNFGNSCTTPAKIVAWPLWESRVGPMGNFRGSLAVGKYRTVSGSKKYDPWCFLNLIFCSTAVDFYRLLNNLWTGVSTLIRLCVLGSICLHIAMVVYPTLWLASDVNQAKWEIKRRNSPFRFWAFDLPWVQFCHSMVGAEYEPMCITFSRGANRYELAARGPI